MYPDLPWISYPLPILPLPPLPDSAVEPLPPEDDPRLRFADPKLSPEHWYMYSALQNNDNYQSGFFGWGDSDIHMGDIVVPVSNPPQNFPEAKEEELATGWRMECYTCLFNASHVEPERNGTTGYPFCDERMLRRKPLSSYASLDEPELEIPIDTESDVENTMACTVQLNLKSAWTTMHTDLTDLYMLRSRFFIVSRTIRGSESEYTGVRFRYNETFPNGVPDGQIRMPDDLIDEPGHSSYPPATTTRERPWWVEPSSTSGYGYTSASWSPSLDNDDDNDSRPKTGVLIGTMVPLILLIAILAFLYNLKKKKKSLAKETAPVRRNLDPAADERRQAGLPERRYIARRNLMAAQAAVAAGGTAITRPDVPEEMPPAYHKVVTNRERMEIEQQMHAERRATEALPPAYPDAQNAASTPVSQPPPVASIPEQNRDLYPQLPPSPPR